MVVGSTADAFVSSPEFPLFFVFFSVPVWSASCGGRLGVSSSIGCKTIDTLDHFWRIFEYPPYTMLTTTRNDPSAGKSDEHRLGGWGGGGGGREGGGDEGGGGFGKWYICYL